MTSVPYPTFTNLAQLRDQKQSGDKPLSLECVGRIRLDCHELLASSDDELAVAFNDIVKKCTEQALAGLDSAVDEDRETQKRLQKKFMKESVAMAKTFLVDSLQLDVSVVNIEIVLTAQDITTTDGCLASCWLDAGCTRVVVLYPDQVDLVSAFEAAKVPRERLGAHFTYCDSTKDIIAQVGEYCSSVSCLLSGVDQLQDPAVLELIKSTKDTEVVYQVPVNGSTLSDEDLGKAVAEVCKKGKEGACTVSLISPTASQLGTCYAACMVTDRPDGLYTTVVCTRGGEALGLVYSSVSSIVAALECGRGVYYSRSRKGLWRKGDTSGHYQVLHRLDVDCDGDALRFTATQRGDDHAAFCHLNTLTCWGPPVGVRHLQETLQQRLASAPAGSYTKRLFEDTNLLRDKLVEEAQELAEADTKQHVAEELADVLYFSMVRAVQAGVSIDDAIAELDARTRKVTRRPGHSKAFRIAAGNAILEKKEEAN